MIVRSELSGTQTFVYTQTWSIDNRPIGVTKALTSGTVLAQTGYFFDGDGTRVKKMSPRARRVGDPDGTALYFGPMVGGQAGTAIDYYDATSQEPALIASERAIMQVYACTLITTTAQVLYDWGTRLPRADMGGDCYDWEGCRVIHAAVTLGDDPYDSWWVRVGYEAYSRFGSDLSKVSRQDFQQWLDWYRSKQDPQPKEPIKW